MIEKWKFINRTELLRHPRMTIVEDDVELPNGVQTKYIRHAPGVGETASVLAFNDEGQILIAREYSYPPNEVLYQFPGGYIEVGEDPVTAADRELREEAGFTAKDFQQIGSFYRDNRRSDAKQYVFVAHNLVPTQAAADPEEFIENTWATIEEVETLVAEGKILNITMLAALSLYKAWTATN